MRNGLARHVKTNVKNQVKQRTKQKSDFAIMAAECCYYCKHRYILYGHHSDAVECMKHDHITVRHVETCAEFERRE